ncbi:NADP-dependent oxidoreductase [Actinoplanes sp. NBC_00393]|uniref:NADP-dependent oxidoreductase n=1 Tax=Actinoplanes sp. NBC_00393 TaxID=2975953 RepID=UPI002E1AAC61
MRAIAVTAAGGPEVLQVVEVPDPVPAAGQVVVRTLAACVNPADIAARVGHIPGGPVPPPFTLGWDIAGEVVAVGDEVSGLAVGDLVVGMIPWFLTRGAIGAYAELVPAEAAWLVPLPAGLDPVVAATVPLNALTAHRALKIFDLTGPTEILVTGASGGVGGFAVQLAAQSGHTVRAQATHDDEAWVRDLGAQTVLRRGADLAAGTPVPAVLDAVPLGDPAAAALSPGGVVVTTRPTPALDPARKVRQEVVLVEVNQLALHDLLEAVADGRLQTRVATTFPLTAAAEAHQHVEQTHPRGKVVLVP